MAGSMKFGGGTKLSIRPMKITALKQEAPFKSRTCPGLGIHSLKQDFPSF